MPQDYSTRVAPGSASDRVGVAEGAAAFLGGEGRVDEIKDIALCLKEPRG